MTSAAGYPRNFRLGCHNKLKGHISNVLSVAHLSLGKLFTISSPEPFQPNLAQTILPRGDDYETANIH